MPLALKRQAKLKATSGIQGNQRNRERLAGSRITNSGTSLSNPVMDDLEIVRRRAQRGINASPLSACYNCKDARKFIHAALRRNSAMTYIRHFALSLVMVTLGGWTGSLQLSSGAAAPATRKPRVIVTTDPELDDSNSLVRYLLYSADFQTEGIIYASSGFHWKGDGKGTRGVPKSA